MIDVIDFLFVLWMTHISVLPGRVRENASPPHPPHLQWGMAVGMDEGFKWRAAALLKYDCLLYFSLPIANSFSTIPFLPYLFKMPLSHPLFLQDTTYSWIGPD